MKARTLIVMGFVIGIIYCSLYIIMYKNNGFWSHMPIWRQDWRLIIISAAGYILLYSGIIKRLFE